MATGWLVITAEDRIVQVSGKELIAAIGDVTGRFGWELVTLGGLRPTAEDARAIHDSVRLLGLVKFGGYRITGPGGSVHVERAELRPTTLDGTYLLLAKLSFFCLTSGPVSGMVDGSKEPTMPPAVTTGVAGFIRPQVPIISEAVQAWAAEMLRQRCVSRSIDRFTKKVLECASWCEWTHITSVDLSDAARWLGHKVDTCDWSGPTHDQACSILRCFGAYLAKHHKKDVPANPLEYLESSGEQGGEGSRALRTDEARAMIREAFRRQGDKRARGNVPAFLLFLCHTGLRHDEAASCCWRDIDLDGETPAIYSDPKWSKNKRRMRVVLNTEIVAVLKWQRSLVPRDKDRLVFPIAPNRHTWGKIREAAGVPDEDARGRVATYHSCRKWFATELDRVGASPGVVSRLLRHAGSLAEERYIDPDPRAEIEAVSKIPSLWPEKEKDFLTFFLERRGVPCDTGDVTTELPHCEETSAPGRNAGMRSSQTSPGDCPGPVTFRVLHSPNRENVGHDNGHSRAQSGSGGVTNNEVEDGPKEQDSGDGSARGGRVAARSPDCGGGTQRHRWGQDGTPRHGGRVGEDGGGTDGSDPSPVSQVLTPPGVEAGTESLTLPTGTGVKTGKAVGPNAGCGAATPRDSETPRRDGELSTSTASGGAVPADGAPRCAASASDLADGRNGSTPDVSSGPTGREGRAGSAGSTPAPSGFTFSPSPRASAGTNTLGAGNDPPERLSSIHDRDTPAAFSDLHTSVVTATTAVEIATTNRSSLLGPLAKLAAAIALAAASITTTVQSEPPFSRGYATGLECFYGAGCVYQPTVTKCLLCCSQYCQGGLLKGCQDACAGGETGGLVAAVTEMADAIQTNKVTGNELAGAVDFIVLACKSDDARVSRIARLVASETPLVSGLVTY